MARRHLVTLEVTGRPATFATAGEKPWKDAVRRAVADAGCAAQSGRFAVDLEFRLGEARRASEVWDLDNLIKPTLDAMEGIFGLRPWRGTPQPADDQVDEIRAVKRQPKSGEKPGVRIDVWLIEADAQS
jgi:Holliday junction resolvase RusA-like endonuclease